MDALHIEAMADDLMPSLNDVVDKKRISLGENSVHGHGCRNAAILQDLEDTGRSPRDCRSHGWCSDENPETALSIRRARETASRLCRSETIALRA